MKLSAADKQIITALAQDTIAELAPNELTRFTVTCEAFFQNGARVSAGGRSEMLAFGAHEVVTFLTPLILMVVTKVLTLTAEPLQAGLTAAVSNSIKSLFARQPSKPPRFQPLTPEQLSRARQVALDTLRDLNFPENKQGLLVDVLVGKLAVLK